MPYIEINGVYSVTTSMRNDQGPISLRTTIPANSMPSEESDDDDEDEGRKVANVLYNNFFFLFMICWKWNKIKLN